MRVALPCRFVLFLVAAAALLGVLGVVSPTAARSATPSPNALTSGHTLVAGSAHDSLASHNGRFGLLVQSKSLVLREYVPDAHGRPNLISEFWQRSDPTGHDIGGNDATVLRMGSDGNLSLRTTAGHTLWTTHTSGTGAHNELYLSDSGALRVATSAGRTVWSSHTTSTTLGPGEHLASGAQMASIPGEGVTPYRIHRLIMQRNGELVLTCGGHVGWRSHTSTPGSYLVLQSNGKLAIRTSHGRTVWITHATTRNPVVWFSAGTPTVQTTTRTLWLMQSDDRYCAS